MKDIRILVVSGLALLSAACSGGGGGGGGSKTPVLVSVSPEQGSSHTIWTLHGDDFPKKLSDIDVYFDGELATVLSVSTGRDAIRVTNAFTPVSTAQAKSVEIRVGKKRSESIAVTAVPDGTTRPMGDAAAIPGAMDALAAEDDTIYIGDAARGVFAYDVNTRVFTRLLRPGFEVRLVTDLAVANGRLLVADDSSAGGEARVSAFDLSTGNLLWSQSNLPAVSALAVADDGTGYIGTSSSIIQHDEDGALVASFAPALAEGCAGLVRRGTDLYCGQEGGTKIVKINAAGSVTDFSTSAVEVNDLTTDGTNLFASSLGSGTSRIDAAGAVTPFAITGPGAATDAVIFAGGEVVVTSPGSGGAFLYGLPTGTTWHLVGGVLEIVLVVERAGDELLLADNVPGACYENDAAEPIGLLFALGPAGGRIVSTESCVFIGLEAKDASTAWFSTAFPGSISTLDLQTGAVTAVLTSADGIGIPYTIALDDSSGELFVSSIELPGSTHVLRVSSDGDVTELGSGLDGVAISMLALDGSVYSSPLDLDNQMGLGVWETSVSGGDAERIITGATPFSDGFAADGAGGFYFTDVLALGVLFHATADGTVEIAAPRPSEAESFNAIELDPATGEIVTAPIELGGGLQAEGDRLLIIAP